MAALKLLTSALSLGLGIGLRFIKGIVYKMLVVTGDAFTVWLNEITIYGKGYDFPSQVSSRAPIFLLGANATDPSKIAINTQGIALLSATTTTDQRAAAIAEPNKYAALSYTEHFLGLNAWVGGLATSNAAGGTTPMIATDGRVGVIRISCGPSANNNARATIGTVTSDNCLDPGAGVMIFATVLAPTVNLFTGAIPGRINVGFTDTDGSGRPVDGAYFESEDGGNWICATRLNNIQTTSVTSLALVLNDWHTFAIKLTSTLAEFYIDSALIASHSTNLPGGSGRQTGHDIKVQKTSSNALEAAVDVDLIHVVIPCPNIPN